MFLILGYGLCYSIKSVMHKMQWLSCLMERFVDSVEVLADNSNNISNDLNTLSSVSKHFTNVTENNNWTTNLMEVIKIYLPLITQMYTNTPIYTTNPLPSFDSIRPTCPANYNPLYSGLYGRPGTCPLKGATGCTGPSGCTGPTGATGPSGCTGVIGSTCPTDICPILSSSLSVAKIDMADDTDDDTDESIDEQLSTVVNNVNSNDTVDHEDHEDHEDHGDLS